MISERYRTNSALFGFKLLKFIVLLAIWSQSPHAVGSTASAKIRVASLSVAADEILVELAHLSLRSSPDQKCNFEISGLSSLAGSAEYSNIATKLPAVALLKADSESILKSGAGLAIVTPFNSPELIAQLRALKIRVTMLERFNSIEDILQNIRQIGEWTHCVDHANEMARALKTKLAAIPTPHTRQTILSWNQNLLLPGANTLFDDIVTRAGGVNILSSHGYQGWSSVTAESLASMRPDLVLVSGIPEDRPVILKQLLQSACCKKMQAVRDGRVLIVPPPVFSAASHHITEFFTMVSDFIKSHQHITPLPPAVRR
jgi:ABC-type Fe3+-hydroxamate transport system substrate-binding protein